MRTRLGLAAALLLLCAAPLSAQVVGIANASEAEAVPVRCVSTDGTTFEACGGTGAAGLTDAELRATPVPVSGTVTVTDGAGAVNVICDSGCAGGTTDTDDGSVATGQTAGLSITTFYVFDGTVWRRLTFGTAGTASAQVFTVQGIAAMTPLLVNGSGVTQPVSGTFWQATQPVSGTFFQATQPVSAAALPLPAGAATAALQTQPGVDIGDVTVNNAAGAAAVNVQDGGNVLTVDGTVTITDGAGAVNVIVDSIAAGNNNIGNVDVLTVPAPLSTTGTGTEAAALRVTIATDSTGLLSVDDNGGSLTVDGSVTANAGTNLNTSALALEATQSDVRTAVQLIDNAVSGAGFNVTQFAGAAVPIGAGAEATALRVTVATDSTGVLSVDDNGGALTVDGTVTVTDGAGAINVICDSGCTPGGSFADNAAFTFGTDAINVGGYVFDDTAPNAVTENSAAAPRMAANRVPYSTIRDAAGNERGALVTAANELLVELGAGAASIGTLGANSGVDIGDVTLTNATLAVTQSGTWDEVGINDSGNSITVDGTVTVTDGAGALNVIVDSGTITIGTFPDNEPINVAQINGVTPLMGAGNTGTGSPRVTLSTDQAALPGLGIYVEDVAETAGANLNMAGSVRRDVAATSAGATAENATVNTDALGLLWTRQLDPCTGVAKVFVVINISTATTTELTPALSGASAYYYVCSINLVTAAASNIALADDNTDGCGSVTAGLAGGLTAASGWNFAANGGLTLGNGGSTVMRAVTANSVLCLVTSAATQVSGHMVVVAAP